MRPGVSGSGGGAKVNRKDRRRLAKESPTPPHSGGVDVQYQAAVQLQRAERQAEAAAAYRRVIGLAPNHSQAHLGLGVALRLLGDPSAVAVLSRAAQLAPDDPNPLINLANALQEHGDTVQAREVAARLLADHPTHPMAWAVQTGLKTFVAGDPDLDRMEALLARLAGAGEPEVILGFALGKAWMDVGDADRAFARLSRANRLQRATWTYDVTAETRRFAAIPRGVEKLAQLASGPGDPSETPIFVVGMPRSGTTLVEQILASHADIAAGGELTAFHEATRQSLAEAGLAPRDGQAGRFRVDEGARLDPARLGRAYLDRVRHLAAGKARLVDKMPDNFQNLGLIALALPKARILHVRRDPVDTCLSCWTTRFVNWKPYAYDLVELGRYYRAYDALMDHWRAILPPDRFLEVRYEDVIGDLEAQARRMIAFCGLDWDPACLSFHETRRPVLTASVNQVRRPLYSASQGRWRAYESHLGPLLAALGEGLTVSPA